MLDNEATARAHGWVPHDERNEEDERTRRAQEVSSSDSSSSSSRGWPAPLGEDAFHGLVGEIVRTIEPHTEADPVAILVQTLVAFGNAVGPRPYVLVERDRHHANLFAVLVGDTAKARKGTSWGYARDLVTSADPEWERCVVSGLSTGEGLIWHARDPIVKQIEDDDGELREHVVDEGAEDKRVLALETELARVFQVTDRIGNTLSPTLRDAWDARQLRTLTKQNATVATGAHVSIIGHVTGDELRRKLDRTEIANGFANRFLWLCVRRARLLPWGGEQIDDALRGFRVPIARALERARRLDDMTVARSARPLWEAAYADLAGSKPGLVGALTARGEAITLRLALHYALLDEKGEIEAEHLQAALALWRYAEASTIHIWGTVNGDPDIDLIHAALIAAPRGLARTDLHALFGRNAKAERINAALRQLETAGLAHSQRNHSTGGRAEERWYAT